MTIIFVFYPFDIPPYTANTQYSLDYEPGDSLAWVRKNIKDLHAAYRSANLDTRILEISSKFPDSLGVSLNAFSLKLPFGDLSSVSVECVFQAAKVFVHCGPYDDLLMKTSKEAKTDPRLRKRGTLTGFQLRRVAYPTNPKTAFYNWLYLQGLKHNPNLADQLQ